MKAFQFRLQTLQRLREQTRDVAQRDLASALLQQTELQQHTDVLQGELQGLENHMRSAVKRTKLDVDRVMDGHRHQLSLQAKLAQLGKAMAEAKAEVQRCREKLTEADREVKVLEKLHERQLAEHARQQAQHEAKQLDEVASTRVARNGI